MWASLMDGTVARTQTPDTFVSKGGIMAQDALLTLVTRFTEHRGTGSIDSPYVQIISAIQYFSPVWEDGEQKVFGVAKSESELSSFQIACYITVRDGVYGWTHYMDIYHTTLEDAQRSIKVLNRVFHGLERWYTRFGRITTYGQYTIAIAESLGIKSMVIDQGKRALDITGHRYNLMPNGAAADYINNKIDYKLTDWAGNRWEIE